METSPHPRKKGQPGTYVMNDRQGKDDLKRLESQARLFTALMGGPLSEQSDPTIFQQALDIGSGSGSWAIEAAETYPTLSLTGIDINQTMINYANEQAKTSQVDDRVKFLVMDALRKLDFPDASFDLVNLRLGLSFIRTWDWPTLINEMLRVTRPGGTIKLTDTEVMHNGNSPALKELTEMSLCAFFRAGHLFTEESSGLTAHLPRLLTQYGCQQVQSKAYYLESQANTPNGQLFFEDIKQIFSLVRPFLQKWGCAPKNYDEIYQQALIEMQQSDFYFIWNLHSAWGITPNV
jgi:ubiquinone/menaquinone biosynthesis C-methylase UbiE